MPVDALLTATSSILGTDPLTAASRGESTASSVPSWPSICAAASVSPSSHGTCCLRALGGFSGAGWEARRRLRHFSYGTASRTQANGGDAVGTCEQADDNRRGSLAGADASKTGRGILQTSIHPRTLHWMLLRPCPAAFTASATGCHEAIHSPLAAKLKRSL